MTDAWRAVPLVPTPEMIKAVTANWRPHPSAPKGWDARVTKMYQLMVTAAPPRQVAQTPGDPTVNAEGTPASSRPNEQGEQA